MRYQAVIFDLDGVLCHTDECHYLAWKRIADEIGVHFDQQINHRLRGVSRRQSLEIISESYDGTLSEEEKKKYTDQKNEIYRESLKEMSPTDVSPEVTQTLIKLKDMGLKLAIGSSSRNAPFILQQLDLAKYFDAVSDGNNITHSKPHPEVFLKASEFLGVSPRDCLVVEDAKSGLEAALAANMDCVAMGEATKYTIAHYNIENLTELIPIVSV